MITYTKNGKQYRIIGQWRSEYERGYIEPERVLYNVRQVRFLWIFWREVERERVPAFAWIESATLGGTDWKSEMIARSTAPQQAGA